VVLDVSSAKDIEMALKALIERIAPDVRYLPK
jgi:hypothetical protein